MRVWGLCNSLVLVFSSIGSKSRARHRYRIKYFYLPCLSVTGTVFKSSEEESGRLRLPKRGMEDEVGQSPGARRNSGPPCTYSQASWDSLKEDARLAPETCPRFRRPGSVRLAGGVGEEPPRGPSLELLPGARAALSQARLSASQMLNSFPLCKENPGRRTSAAAGEAGMHWASSRLALFSISVLFIPALPSLHCPLDRRAFFLSFLVLSSDFFCMITFLPD